MVLVKKGESVGKLEGKRVRQQEGGGCLGWIRNLAATADHCSGGLPLNRSALEATCTTRSGL